MGGIARRRRADDRAVLLIIVAGVGILDIVLNDFKYFYALLYILYFAPRAQSRFHIHFNCAVAHVIFHYEIGGNIVLNSLLW